MPPEFAPYVYVTLVFLAGIGLRTLARSCDIGLRVKARTWSIEFLVRPKRLEQSSDERPKAA